MGMISVASWITYPIAWNWWRPDPDDVALMRRRAQRVGVRGWFAIGGPALAGALLLGLFHC
jgi:hypothetical protein